MNKENLKRIKAALLAATMGATLSGCNFNITDGEKNIKVEVELDEKDKQELINKIAKEINSRTTSKEETTTSTTESTETTYTETFTTTTTTETTLTNPVVTTETTTESTETTTEPTKLETNYDFSKIAFDFWYLEEPYSYTDEEREFTLGSEYPTVYSLAYKFCPVGMKVNDFLKQIQEINPDVGTKLGDIIKVPVRKVYSKEAIKYIIPVGTTEYKISDKQKLYLYNKIAVAAYTNCQMMPLSKNYTKGVTTSFIEVSNNNYGTNTCFIMQHEGDEFISYQLADNIKRVYFVDDIPVFEARSIEDCYQLEYLEDGPFEFYTTVATTKDKNAYNFYKDSNGNICFTFDKTDLTKYGYTKAPEVAKYFFRTDRYYAQDETGYEGHYADLESGLKAFIEETRKSKQK